MKKSIKYILVALASASAGAAGAYFYTKKYFEEKADKEIAEIKDVYDKHRTELINRLEKKYEDEVSLNKMVTEVKATTEHAEIDYSTKKTLNVMQQYNKLYGDPSETNDEEPVDAKQDEPATTDMIEYVAEEEFEEENPDYTREYCTYYSNDILANEDGDEIFDIQGTVGVEFTKHFRNGLCCVRNNATMTEYQIDYFNTPYGY